MKNSIDIKTLKESLNLNTITKSAYERLLDCTNNEILVEWLELKIEVLSDCIFDLTIELNSDGFIYNNNFRTRFTQLLYIFKYSTYNNDNSILNESKKLDRNLIEKLRQKTLVKALSKDTKNILKNEISSIDNINTPQIISSFQLH